MTAPASVTHWTNRLSNKHWRSRAKACAELGQLGHKAAVDALAKHLADSSGQVRLAAVAALQKIGEPRSAVFLIAHLADRDRQIRLAACNALEVLGLANGAAVEPLLRCLADEDLEVREAASATLKRSEASLAHAVAGALESKPRAGQELRRLAAKGDRRCLSFFLELLRDTSWKRRQAACIALGYIGAESAVGPLIVRLEDTSPNVQSAAKASLEQMGQSRLSKGMIGALEGQNEALQDLARLVDEGDARPVEFLMLRLKDDSARIRQAACAALARLRDPRVVQSLIERLTDENLGVRMTVCKSLGTLGGEAALDALVRQAGDNSAKVRQAVAFALLELKHSGALGSLVSLLDDSDREVALAARACLGESGDRHAAAPLIAKLGHGHSKLRVATCVALGRLRDSASINPLVAEAGDPDMEVRRAVCTALAEIGEIEVAKILTSLLENRIDVIPEVTRMSANGDLRLVEPLRVWVRDGSWKLRLTVRKVLYAIWQVAKPRINSLICPIHLTRFKKHTAGIPFITQAEYPACPVCDRAWPVVSANKVVAVLDSESTADQWKNGEALWVNCLVRNELFDFEEVEIVRASDDEVQRFVGLIKSDPDTMARCRRIRCRIGIHRPLKENTKLILKSVFATIEGAIG